MSFDFSGMILAAGYGRRMMPLTKNLPKPLIEINGITLLDNSINFLKKLGCKDIVINTHYQHQKIKESIDRRSDKKIITLIYENDILDTGGGVKNILPYIKNKNLIVSNSDIFWQKENLLDAKKLLKLFLKKKLPSLLLVNKKKSYGLNKNNGDFFLNDNKVMRYKKGEQVFFYTGLQILPTEIINNFSQKKFSLNYVWDFLINLEKLYGEEMDSNWYHVGDIQGLAIAKKIVS